MHRRERHVMTVFDNGLATALQVYDTMMASMHSQLPTRHYQVTVCQARYMCRSVDGSSEDQTCRDVFNGQTWEGEEASDDGMATI